MLSQNNNMGKIEFILMEVQSASYINIACVAVLFLLF